MNQQSKTSLEFSGLLLSQYSLRPSTSSPDRWMIVLKKKILHFAETGFPLQANHVHYSVFVFWFALSGLIVSISGLCWDMHDPFQVNTFSFVHIQYRDQRVKLRPKLRLKAVLRSKQLFSGLDTNALGVWLDRLFRWSHWQSSLHHCSLLHYTNSGATSLPTNQSQVVMKAVIIQEALPIIDCRITIQEQDDSFASRNGMMF